VIARLTRQDEGYPGALLDLQQPADPLYAIGDVGTVEGSPDRLVAIVGTRDASTYGIRVATALGKSFARAGIVVVSGMARGVDTAAHHGALAAGGRTVAVLGTGPDVPYPVGNRALHADVSRTGLVLSEFEPGRRAGPGCFPRRNRIIAALARVTIVVEAGFKSGAMNTADWATKLGRMVGGVPGPIDSPRSAGVNRLLRDGAHVIGSVDDALGLFGLSRNATAAAPTLGQADSAVWDVLTAGQGTPDDLAPRAKLTLRQTLESLARLELAGLIVRLPTGEVARAELD